jgi:hypothetical protein
MVKLFAAGFFGFPTWYQYLPTEAGEPTIKNLTDIWLVVAAIFEMILRLGGMAAVGYFIYSGFRFVTSQGNPEVAAQARKGLLSAIVGLIIMILAANLVALIMGVVQ